MIVRKRNVLRFMSKDENGKPKVEHKHFPSVAAARRESFKIQMEKDKGLGRGSVQVVE